MKFSPESTKPQGGTNALPKFLKPDVSEWTWIQKLFKETFAPRLSLRNAEVGDSDHTCRAVRCQHFRWPCATLTDCILNYICLNAWTYIVYTYMHTTSMPKKGTAICRMFITEGFEHKIETSQGLCALHFKRTQFVWGNVFLLLLWSVFFSLSLSSHR